MDILPQFFKPGAEMPERFLTGQVEWLHVWLATPTAMWAQQESVCFLRHSRLQVSF